MNQYVDQFLTGLGFRTQVGKDCPEIILMGGQWTANNMLSFSNVALVSWVPKFGQMSYWGWWVLACSLSWGGRWKGLKCCPHPRNVSGTTLSITSIILESRVTHNHQELFYFILFPISKGTTPSINPVITSHSPPFTETLYRYLI